MRKVALVTGSSRGIGAACIILFAQKGYDVVINYKKDEEQAKKIQSLVTQNYQVKALCIKADVASSEDCDRMLQEILNAFGRIDVLVNNAGVVLDKPLLERTREEFAETLSTNLIGPFLLSKLVTKPMLEQRRGGGHYQYYFHQCYQSI